MSGVQGNDTEITKEDWDQVAELLADKKKPNPLEKVTTWILRGVMQFKSTDPKLADEIGRELERRKNIKFGVK